MVVYGASGNEGTEYRYNLYILYLLYEEIGVRRSGMI